MDPIVSKRLDILRILVINFVVLAHAGKNLLTTVNVTGLTPGMNYLYHLLNMVLAFATVPVFFAISGYLFLPRFKLSVDGYKDLLLKKTRTILVPFLLFNGFWIAWFFLVGSIEGFGAKSAVVAEGVLVKLVGYKTLPANYPLWFLRDLFLLFVFAPVWAVLASEARKTCCLALLAAYVFGSPEAAFSYPGFVFFFFLGGVLGLEGVDLKAESRGFALMAAAAPVLALVLSLNGIAYEMDPLVFQFLHKVFLLLSLPALWWVTRAAWLLKAPWLSFASRHTFFIYLAHEPLLSVLQGRLAKLLPMQTFFGQFTFYFGATALVVAFLALLGAALGRFLPRVYAVLTGGRLSKPSCSPVLQSKEAS